MSTKKIEQALHAASMDIPTELYDEACNELEAIRKAGRYGYLMMSGDVHVSTKEEQRAGDTVFGAIYEETGRSEG